MKPNKKAVSLLRVLLAGFLLSMGARSSLAQVSPAEILNPQLKAAEETYLPQLKTLNRSISATKFPFAFVLSRYVGLDPAQQRESDSRGIEFVNFHERTVLKITGNYNAAYNSSLLTRNERASRTFREVIVPLLRLVAREIPADVTCDAFGFEVSYHVRKRTSSSDFEGKEILVIVFDKADAQSFLSSAGETEQQEVLNRSEVYVSGQEFGLALGARDPLNLEALGKAAPKAASPAPTTSISSPNSRTLRLNSDGPLGTRKPAAPIAGIEPGNVRANSSSGTETGGTLSAPVAAATPADAERLQAKYQSQLDALAKQGAANLQFVDYAPPSFVIFHNQVVLQFTLRNPLHFDKETSSIYKRAAQSFDLFLAPNLKALLEKLPAGEEFAGLDITLLNQLAAKPNTSSEALEFICPLRSLRQFTDAEITNQDLINQSVVLVNGVRIALNLQQVE